jgi:hypothetical protein
MPLDSTEGYAAKGDNKRMSIADTSLATQRERVVEQEEARTPALRRFAAESLAH